MTDKETIQALAEEVKKEKSNAEGYRLAAEAQDQVFRETCAENERLIQERDSLKARLEEAEANVARLRKRNHEIAESVDLEELEKALRKSHDAGLRALEDAANAVIASAQLAGMPVARKLMDARHEIHALLSDPHPEREVKADPKRCDKCRCYPGCFCCTNGECRCVVNSKDEDPDYGF